MSWAVALRARHRRGMVFYRYMRDRRQPWRYCLLSYARRLLFPLFVLAMVACGGAPFTSAADVAGDGGELAPAVDGAAGELGARLPPPRRGEASATDAPGSVYLDASYPGVDGPAAVDAGGAADVDAGAVDASHDPCVINPSSC